MARAFQLKPAGFSYLSCLVPKGLAVALTTVCLCWHSSSSQGLSSTGTARTDTRAGTNWWALREVTEPKLPDVKRPNWVGNGIDRFILAGLEAKKLSPSPEADRK